jgi:hypothetical protein
MPAMRNELRGEEPTGEGEEVDGKDPGPNLLTSLKRDIRGC